MIRSLTLSNFKSWEHIDSMRIAPITMLFGANSSGKSSIIQLLMMLKQTSESSDRNLVLDFGDTSSHADLGTFQDVIYNHDTSRSLSFTIDWQLPTPIDIRNPEARTKPLFRSKDLSLRSDINIDAGSHNLKTSRIEYTIGDNRFIFTDTQAGKRLTAEASSFQFKRADGRKWPLPPAIRFYGFADEVRTYHKNAGFLSDLELRFERLLRGLYYLGPLREHPKRQYPWSGSDPANMGSRGENAIAAILASRQKEEKISRGKGKPRYTLEEYVAYWLKQLGLIDSFRVEEIATGTNLYRVHVQKRPGSAEVLITDVGFGVSQILPILVLCYYVPENSTILFEQPEIHLHPSVQSGLADVFLDAYKVRNVQFIIESHSEHLLRRLQRRIAEPENDIDENTFAGYFCQSTGASSELVELEVDMYGNILNWPEDFFGDEFSDIVAQANASERRQKQA